MFYVTAFGFVGCILFFSSITTYEERETESLLMFTVHFCLQRPKACLGMWLLTAPASMPAKRVQPGKKLWNCWGAWCWVEWADAFWISFGVKSAQNYKALNPLQLTVLKYFFVPIFNQKGSWLLNGIQDSQYAAFLYLPFRKDAGPEPNLVAYCATMSACERLVCTKPECFLHWGGIKCR